MTCARGRVVACAVGVIVGAIGCGDEFDSGGSNATGGSSGAGASGSGGSAGASGAAGNGGAAGCPSDLSSNPDHCGACDHSCLGGDCKGGKCQPAVIFENDAAVGGVGTLADIEIDDGYVFFTDAGDLGSAGLTGAVWRMKLDGSDPSRLDAPGSTEATQLALNSASVLWTGHEGAIKRVGKSGGPTDTLATEPASSLRSLATAGNILVYAAGADVEYVNLVSLDVKTSSASQPSPQRVALHGTTAFFTALGTPPEYQDGFVSRVEIDGSATKVLAFGYVAPNALVVDGETVFFTTATGGVYRAPMAGGADPIELFAPVDDHDASPQDLALDGDHLVWTAWGPCANANGCNGTPLKGRVSRIPKTKGERVILAEGPFLPTGIAVGEDAYYWTNWWFGSVTRLAK